MLGSEILEVAIGVIFVFLLVSIACSAIREGIEAWFKSRAAYLEYGIRELLHDRRAMGLANSLYNHPLVHGLYPGGYPGALSSGQPPILAHGASLPSYIPSRTFALALLDMAARGPDTDILSSDPDAPAISIDSIRLNLLRLQNPPVQRVLLTAMDVAQGDLNRLIAEIEAWYNGAMDRVSGLYKRSTQWIILWIGFAVAVVLNVNAIQIADFLYRNDTARAAIVARAETAATDTAFLSRTYAETRAEIDVLKLPTGWEDVEFHPPWEKRAVGRTGDGAAVLASVWPSIWHYPWWSFVLLPLLGWICTGLAATFGAPFWFDLLNKVMVIRATVKPHEKSPEEGSEDRQLPAPKPADAPEHRWVAYGGVEQPRWEGTRIEAAPIPPGIPPVAPPDAESALDGCDVAIAGMTADDELPVAEGGVA
jgi:hypothetical protein